MYSFFPSDYLVIRTDPEILQLTFDSDEPVDHYQVLERKISQFFGTENVLLFPDGYLAFVALVRNLIQEGDVFFIPPESDGAVLDVLEIIQRHCESARFETLTSKSFENLPSATSRIVILASGVSESAGKIAPVTQWIEQLECLYESRGIPGLILLDDSHGVGLLGKRYRGTFDFFDVPSNHFPDPSNGVQCFFSASLAETFGACGGFIAGDRKWLRSIRRTDPCCCQKNQIPLSNVVAAEKALELVCEISRHEQLKENAQILSEKLREAKISFITDPDLPFALVKASNPKGIVKAMSARGCRISLTHFTKKTQLCLAVNASHKELEIGFLVETLANLLTHKEEKTGIPDVSDEKAE